MIGFFQPWPQRSAAHTLIQRLHESAYPGGDEHKANGCHDEEQDGSQSQRETILVGRKNEKAGDGYDEKPQEDKERQDQRARKF